MKKFSKLFSHVLMTSIYILGGCGIMAGKYDVDFVIQNTPETIMRIEKFNFSSAQLREANEKKGEKSSAKIGDVFNPCEKFTIRIRDELPTEYMDIRKKVAFEKQTDEQKQLDKSWQSITFVVKISGIPDQEIPLYWAAGDHSIFGVGSSENFYFGVSRSVFPKGEKNIPKHQANVSLIVKKETKSLARSLPGAQSTTYTMSAVVG